MHARGRRAASRFTRPGRNPFQTWVVVASALTGVLALLPLDGQPEGVVERYLPPWAVYLWYVGLSVGGTLTLLATTLRERTVTRQSRLLEVEQLGLTVLGGLLVSYGAAIEVLAPRVPSGLLTLGLGVACVARWRQVRRERLALLHLVESLVERRDERSPPCE